ncbi:DNA polymerase III subunit gamma/tau [Leptolyngbya sp. AN10]|uniref:DNA polymerase III subunit gamma/tau n=1 Tax=Leptolyngbya sp. AN10 TaxID=3423365 RepID=UPI003D32126B
MTLQSTQTSLPLKYRPQKLADLIGQPYVQKTLSNAIRTQRIPPALLFVGSKGTGKTSTARIVAKSLNCLVGRPTLSPCGQCESCRKIELGIDIDVTEIDAASNTGVDDARELIQRIQIKPMHGDYRIVIIDEAHQLSVAAQNCLLKTFEEPPSHIVFILCTTDGHKLLGTITDRCMKFHFHPLSVETIVAHLRQIAEQETINITEGALREIARASAGGPRNAINLLDTVFLSGEAITEATVADAVGDVTGKDLIEILHALHQKDRIALLIKAQQLIDNGKYPSLIVEGLMGALRDLLLILTTGEQAFTFLSTAISPGDFQALEHQWNAEQISKILDHLYQRETQIRYTSNIRLWLEVTLLGLIPGSPSQTNSHPIEKPLNLEKLWDDVIQAIRPESRPLLENVKLIKLNSTATLKIPAQQQEILQAKIAPLTKTIARISKIPDISVILEPCVSTPTGN